MATYTAEYINNSSKGKINGKEENKASRDHIKSIKEEEKAFRDSIEADNVRLDKEMEAINKGATEQQELRNKVVNVDTIRSLEDHTWIND
jgi:hypothetical protein